MNEIKTLMSPDGTNEELARDKFGWVRNGCYIDDDFTDSALDALFACGKQLAEKDRRIAELEEHVRMHHLQEQRRNRRYNLQEK